MSAASPLDQARQLRDQGRSQEAYTCLQQLRWPQTDLEPYLLKGVLERQLGLINEAHSSLALALGHPGHQGLACYELGELMRSQGQFDAAASWFLAALRQAPQHPWIHHSLQFTRFGPALLPLVAAEYERHCQACPGDAMALHLLADVQLRLERQSEAIRSARLAARLLPSPAQAAWLAAPEAEPSPPDFVIIGVPKGGTTSLLHWLGHHPQICSHPRKELHFFNGAWEQGTSWYAAQFPVFAAGSGILRGEATPNYFHHPQVPARLASAAPQARLILLLRDPLQRAISWIEHLRRYEGLQGSTEVLLMAELEQLEACPAVISGLAAPPPGPQALLGSCYDAPLARWQHAGNPLLLLRSEELFEHPAQTLQRCASFLGIAEAWPEAPLHPQNVNPQRAAPLSASAQARLRAFLAEHNQHLQQACGH